MGDGAVGHLFHLPGEDGHGGLRLDDVIADEHADGDQQPFLRPGGHRGPDELARGHKAHVDPAQEQNQPQIGVDQSGAHPQQLVALEPPGDHLKDQEDAGDGQQSQGHLPEIVWQSLPEVVGGLGGGVHLGDEGLSGGGLLRPVQDAQQQHRQNGSDGAQGDQAEAVAGGVLVAAAGGHPKAQGHDEGDGDGSGGDAPGVEGDGDEVARGEGGQGKDDQIEDQQQPAQGDAQFDPLGGHHQEEAHPDGHGEDQHQIANGGHLFGQHLQVGLGHRGQHPQQEVDHDGHQGPAALAEDTPHALPHGGHGHLHPQGAQAHSAHQQDGPEEEQDQGARLQGGDGNG